MTQIKFDAAPIAVLYLIQDTDFGWTLPGLFDLNFSLRISNEILKIWLSTKLSGSDEAILVIGFMVDVEIPKIQVKIRFSTRLDGVLPM